MARPTRSRPIWRSFPDHARPRRAALYASYGLLVGFHTLAFWKTMRRLSTVPVAVSKGTQQALPFLLSHILFCHSARDDAHLFRGDPNLCMSVSKHGLRQARRAVVALAEAALVLHLHGGRRALCAGSRAKASSSTSATATAPLAATAPAAYECTPNGRRAIRFDATLSPPCLATL